VLDDLDITHNTWSHQVGTLGEYLQLYTDAGSSVANWMAGKGTPGTPLTWYMLSMVTPQPQGDPAYSTWMFDMSGMGKGELWCNGFMLGAYWSIKDGQGHYSQQYYHLPRDYLAPVGMPNLVVLLEEVGGDPDTITLMQRNYRPFAEQKTSMNSHKHKIANNA